MKEIIVAFGTETGNAESLADEVASKLSSANRAHRVVNLEDFSLEELDAADLLLLITSTYGEGEAPSDAEDFHEELMEVNDLSLSQLSFSVCALGDTSYELFCQCGKDFDRRLEELGGRRIAPRVDCDVDYDEGFKTWWTEVERALSIGTSSQSSESSSTAGATHQPRPPIASVSSFEAPPPSILQPRVESPKPPQLNPIPPRAINPRHESLRGQDETTKLASISSITGQRTKKSELLCTKKRPLFAQLTENRNLNHPQSAKETRHLSFSLEGAEVEYEVGDALGVCPRNDGVLVADLLAFLSLDRETRVSFEGRDYSLFYVLKYKKDIVKIDKRFFDLINPSYASPRIQNALNDSKARKAYLNDFHLIDLVQEVQIRPTPDQLLESLRALQPRLYSISSSPKAHPGQVQLTVDVLKYDLHGVERKGVSSNFLAESEVGGHAEVYVHTNKAFRLCDSEAPMIMIGPGTGIAPFRAMLEEREATKARGQSWLFFGSQRSAQDFLYQDQLEAWVQSGVITQLDCAWSRDQEYKVYVQDLMYTHGAGIWLWLEAGAYIYVCGDAQRMAKDVDAMLLRIIREFGKVTPDQAKDYMAQVKAQKRYRRDVY